MKPLNRACLRYLPLLALALAGCGHVSVLELSPPEVLQAPALAQPAWFSLSAGTQAPCLAYVDPQTSALVLADLEGAARPAYVDRVTDLPEQDPLLGAHLLFADGGFLHLLYLDRQSEDSRLLKHLTRPAEQASLIDVLPVTGKPVAAFVLADGALDLFLERDGALYREGPLGSGALVQAPFEAAGPASRIVGQNTRGFTVYDSSSRRLLLFLDGAGQAYTIARFGEAQDCLLAADGRLQAAAYDPRTSRLVLFETANPGDGFSVQPVTLSRDTTALAVVDFGGRPGFLFNETAPRGDRRHLVSLLYPSAGAGAPYAKAILHRSTRPASGLRAVQRWRYLYVAFFEEEVRVLRVDVAQLEGRRE